MPKILKSTDYGALTEVAPEIFILDGSLTAEFCKEAIEAFNAEDRRGPGITGNMRVDKSIKDSIDFHIPGQEQRWKRFDTAFYKALNIGVKQFVALMQQHWEHYSQGIFEEDTGYQIQETKPGGFYKWHVETTGAHQNTRTLTFMWYLNDNYTGGCTGFKRQGVEVEPKTGRLVLFSPYWSHLHCGFPVETGTKYICTGWLHAKG